MTRRNPASPGSTRPGEAGATAGASPFVSFSPYDSGMTTQRMAPLPTTAAGGPAAPAHRWQLVGLSTIVGLLIAAVWSASFVDTTIGVHVANTVVGHDAKAVGIGGTAAGLLFALAAGLG